MKERYRLIRLSHRGGMFYMLDSDTGKRISLNTKDGPTAKKLVAAKNETLRNPTLNLQLARVYLSATDPATATRTWQNVMDAIVNSKPEGSETRRRWEVAVKQKAFNSLRNKVVLESSADDLLNAVLSGTVSTNTHLRKIQNFAIGMNWLPWPILGKKMFPKVRHKKKRAITWEEHQLIVQREGNEERRRFYELSWFLGGSQGDIARLEAEDIDWTDRTICYNRKKLEALEETSIRPPLIRFGDQCAALLQSLPQSGPLFPYLRTLRPADRATEFKQRCQGLKIAGVTLHSYRYAWAERAKKCGYPLRYAQEALGHNSKAVHHAYASKAQVTVPSLEEYEASGATKVVQLPIPPDPPDRQSTKNVA